MPANALRPALFERGPLYIQKTARLFVSFSELERHVQIAKL